MKKIEDQRKLFKLIDIEVSFNQIKANNHYSFYMAHFVRKLKELSLDLENDIEYSYDKLLDVYQMLMKVQTWKHIKVTDKHKLIELQKDLRTSIDRISTTFDL
ncbi:MAG: hypothetical protein IJW36_02045 [Clostridia bacterium]|nr:hypothetical protein [Clostridia bacterium]